MPSHLQRGDCSFCQYYDAHHSANRFHCVASCTRRGGQREQPSTSPKGSSDGAAVFVAAPHEVPFHTATSAAHCVHRIAPFHHCRRCVLPPYFQHPPAQWDGHAVVCAPHCVRPDGCGCSRRCACRRRGEAPPLPQFAAHELPVMGARAALYTKS